MLKKLINRRKHEGVPAKEGGHGDHWHCIYPDPRSGSFVSSIEHLVNRSSPALVENGIAIYRSPGDSVSMTVLVRRNSVVTAFPQVVGGPEWPIELTQIIPWRNGIEGQLVGVCLGAEVRFFDTSFYANRHTYTIGNIYDFRMGALAYHLSPGHDLEAEVEGGAKVSLKGAHAYMPANMSGEGAEIDDYWFHSPLDGSVTAIALNAIALRAYPITIALPHEFEMSLTLYAAPHAESPGTSDISPGDDLQGYLWLQGHHA
jgi:hypothetical protein